jgi:hypothetical protein
MQLSKRTPSKVRQQNSHPRSRETTSWNISQWDHIEVLPKQILTAIAMRIEKQLRYPEHATLNSNFAQKTMIAK